MASGDAGFAVGFLKALGWRMIAIGIGGNSLANERDFRDAIESARRELGGGDAVATLATASFAPRAEAAAKEASVPYHSLMLIALRERSGDCVTRSERSLSLYGINSIAEAAALFAAGPRSQLVMPRRIIGNITVAAARSADAGRRPK